jgi:hypothetical protein
MFSQTHTNSLSLSLSLTHTHTPCVEFLVVGENRVKKQSQVGLLLLLNSFVKKKEFVCEFSICVSEQGLLYSRSHILCPFLVSAFCLGFAKKKHMGAFFWAFDFLRVKESSSF